MEKKNFHTLLGMMTHLPAYKLIIAGNTNFKYHQMFMSVAKRLKLLDRIKILGTVSDHVKHVYIRHCEAFVFPSLREGFGFPPIEAMTYGKPIFLSSCTSLPEIGGTAAYYWNDFDPELMANVFIDGMKDYEQNKTARIKRIQSRARDFSWNHSAKQYIELYKQLLSE